MDREEMDQEDFSPGRLQRIRMRLSEVVIRVPLPSGMTMLVRTAEVEGLPIPPNLPTVLMAHLSAAYLTTAYLDNRVRVLAGWLPGDEAVNLERLKPLTRLAALPQKAAANIILPMLQTGLPNPSFSGARQHFAGAGSRLFDRLLGRREEEPPPEPESSLLLSRARTPALLALSGGLYTVGVVAITVHGTAERLRGYVLRQI